MPEGPRTRSPLVPGDGGTEQGLCERLPTGPLHQRPAGGAPRAVYTTGTVPSALECSGHVKGPLFQSAGTAIRSGHLGTKSPGALRHRERRKPQSEGGAMKRGSWVGVSVHSGGLVPCDVPEEGRCQAEGVGPQQREQLDASYNKIKIFLTTYLMKIFFIVPHVFDNLWCPNFPNTLNLHIFLKRYIIKSVMNILSKTNDKNS